MLTIQNLDENWQLILEKLDHGFISKGAYAKCPFNGCESSSSKASFLMAFNQEGEFEYYNCFKCGSHCGNKFWALKNLSEIVGVEIPVLRSMGKARRASLEVAGEATPKGKEGPPKPIAWPPPWVKDTDGVIVAGLSYVHSRGIVDPWGKVKHHDLVFSEVIEQGGRIIPYPSVIAPCHGRDGEVYGWTSRLIPELAGSLGLDLKHDKTRGMTGSGWKTVGIFGLNRLQTGPNSPVVVVEGLFDSLATPNSVAGGGKAVLGIIDILASLKADTYVVALDPDVDERKPGAPSFTYEVATKLQNKLPRASRVVSLDWIKIRESYPSVDDPGSAGTAIMTSIIETLPKWVR